MDRTIAELKEDVARLERAIDTFKGRVEQARWLTAMLERAKAPHPRFPFWEWEHRNLATEAARRRVDQVRTHLHFRLIGAWEFDESCKDILGVPSELLYVARPPTVEEVFTLIKAAGGFSTNEKVIEMFQVMKANGYKSELIDLVLSAVDT
jgi:hypothetical protein